MGEWVEVEIVDDSPYGQAENGHESRGGDKETCLIHHAMMLIGSGQTRINADACERPRKAKQPRLFHVYS